MRAALAACALCLAAALGPGAAAALASGPGVTILSSANSQTTTIPGARIRIAADTGPTTYTVRSSPGSAGTTIRLRGLSIRGLLTLAGFDPDTVDFISIVRPDGQLTTLRRADFANPSPFPEGPALIADVPGGTRYLRPVRGPTNTNARDSFVSATALDMTVGGGALLAVRAGASPTRTSTGRSVSFVARVRFAPPGATLTYEWDFGDSTQHAFGAQVTHRYTQGGDYQAQVTATGSGGSTAACPDTCGGVGTVNVHVDAPATSPRPATTQGSSGANPNGQGTGGSGSGSGGSGSGAGGGSGNGGAGSAAAPGSRAPSSKPRPTPKPKDPTPAPGGPMITGILLADSSTALRSSLPALRSAGGTSTRQTSGSGAQGGGRLGGSIALTLILIALGALHERRGGRLRAV